MASPATGSGGGGDRIRVLAPGTAARDGEAVGAYLRRADIAARQRFGSNPHGRERVPFIARARWAALRRLAADHAAGRIRLEAAP